MIFRKQSPNYNNFMKFIRMNWTSVFRDDTIDTITEVTVKSVMKVSSCRLREFLSDYEPEITLEYLKDSGHLLCDIECKDKSLGYYVPILVYMIINPELTKNSKNIRELLEERLNSDKVYIIEEFANVLEEKLGLNYKHPIFTTLIDLVYSKCVGVYFNLRYDLYSDRDEFINSDHSNLNTFIDVIEELVERANKSIYYIESRYNPGSGEVN